MLHLTKQEQVALLTVLGLLLTGRLVQVYRQAHPPESAAVRHAIR